MLHIRENLNEEKNFADNYDMTPTEAIEWMLNRVSMTKEDYNDLIGKKAKFRAFTVSKLTSLDAIERTKELLNKTLKEGETMKEWYDRLKSDEILSKIGFSDENPFYLETVFRTNTISAYNAGRWEEIQRNKDSIAFLEYIAIDDSRTTEICSSLDGVRLPVDDPFWKEFYPPNHFNCRSQVVEVTPEEVEVFGYKESDKDKIEIPELPKGFDTPIVDAWWNVSSSMSDRVNKYGMKDLFLEKAKDLCKDKKFSDDKDGFCDEYFKVKNKLNGKKGDNIKMDNIIKQKIDIFEKNILDSWINNKIDSSNEQTIRDSFKELWISNKEYDKHYNKRLNIDKVIKNNSDYYNKTIDCLKNSDIFYMEETERIGGWDRLMFFKSEEWLILFAPNGKLLSSMPIYEYYDKIEKFLEKRILDSTDKTVKHKKIEVSYGFKRKIRSL